MPDHVVAFPEKLLKTIATRNAIFSLKFAKNRLAAGLHLEPLGELKRSPHPSSRNMGPSGLLLREGEGREKEVKGGKRREGRKWKGREMGEREMGGKEMGEKGKEGRGSRGGGVDWNTLTHVWLRAVRGACRGETQLLRHSTTLVRHPVTAINRCRLILSYLSRVPPLPLQQSSKWLHVIS